MKALLAVLLVGFGLHASQQAQDPAYQQLFQTNAAACAKENEVDSGIIMTVWTEPEFPANNSALQCFYNCLNIKMGITDAEGNLIAGQVRNLFGHYDNATEVGEVGVVCNNIESPTGDLCEFGYLVVKCVAEIQLS